MLPFIIFHQKKIKISKFIINLEISEKENSGYRSTGYKTVFVEGNIRKMAEYFSTFLLPENTDFDNHPWMSAFVEV